MRIKKYVITLFFSLVSIGVMSSNIVVKADRIDEQVSAEVLKEVKDEFVKSSSVPTKKGNIVWKELQDGTVEIVTYKGEDIDVNIPKEIDGKIVTSIGAEAFCGTYVESVTIPDSVKYIGREAFAFCGQISNINIPNGVAKIDDAAFSHCMMLKNVTIPNSVVEIGSFAFANCVALKSISIPNSIKILGEQAFYECEMLENIKLSHRIDQIGQAVFAGTKYSSDLNNWRDDSLCVGEYPVMGEYEYRIIENVCVLSAYNKPADTWTIPTVIDGYPVRVGNSINLTRYVNHVIVPESIDNVWSYAGSVFSNSKNLQSIYVDESNLYYSSKDGVLFDKAQKTLIQFPAKKVQEIYCVPDTVVSISEHSFMLATSVKGIVIPKSVNEIDQLAFNSETMKIIYGEKGSYAEEYAKNNSFEFKEINSLVNKPTAVTNLKAVGSGKNRVTLTWTASEGSEGYLIYGQKNGKYGYVGMTTKGTTFTDIKALDTEYNFYWVFPYVKNPLTQKMIVGGTSKYVYAKGICSAVQNLKASSVKGGVKLNWSASVGADGYLVYGIVNGGKYGFVGMTTKGTTFTDIKASKLVYNFYWVFPYHMKNGKMIVGGTAPYTYGRAI